MVRYPAGNINLKMGRLWLYRDAPGEQQYSGTVWGLNNAHLVLGGQEWGIPNTIAPAWTIDAMQNGFMPFTPNSDPDICILQQKSTSVRPGDTFPYLLLSSFVGPEPTVASVSCS